jgi:hypothetical protein
VGPRPKTARCHRGLQIFWSDERGGFEHLSAAQNRSGRRRAQRHLARRRPSQMIKNETYLLGLLPIQISKVGYQNGESQRDSGSKPRVARNELPWVGARNKSATPTGLWLGGTANTSTTPLGLAISVRRFPRVARSSQPWAGGHNPVGIGAARWEQPQ